MSKNSKLKVAFVHPDMGIGGAEQLVVNLAVLCLKNNWEVEIFTPYFDPNRSFDQLKDGTIKVTVVGNWFPRRFCGRCQALLEYIRFFLASLYLIIFGGSRDLVIVDQITLSLPLLMFRYKTFFYCHYPDKLLCTERKSCFKRIYRFFIDLTEELCLIFAGMVVVNSNYTKEVFKNSFPIYNYFRSEPKVLYPCSDFSVFDLEVNRLDLLNVRGMERLKSLLSISESKSQKTNKDSILNKNEKDKNVEISLDKNNSKTILNSIEDMDGEIDIKSLNNKKIILTLNRYERKKNLGLAADAYNYLIKSLQKNENNNLDDYIFIVAGGYDERLQENYDVHKDLKEKEYFNTNNVYFLKSISNKERCILLKNADVVLYTPKNEHFGIVPCEALYCGAAVIAHKSGGPIESISSKSVGYLIDSEDPKEWSDVLLQYFSGKPFDKKVLKNYVLEKFSLERMKKDFLMLISENWPKAKFLKTN